MKPAVPKQAAPGVNTAKFGKRETLPILGAQVRDLRKARDMTLQDLADQSGLSVGYLSQLEREQAMPSIHALSVIASSLGVNINWFFPDPDEPDSKEAEVVVRANKRRELRFGSGIRDEMLTPTLSGELELLRCTLEPGADTGPELYEHRGEEAGIVIKGQLQLTVDNDVYELSAGDSFHFASTRPHRYHNPGKSETVVIWAMTPPHY